MNKKLVTGIVGSVVVVVLVAVVFAISQPKKAETTSPSKTEDTGTQTAQPTAESPTITYTDEGFEPATLTVKTGTVIRVVNNASSELVFSSGSHPTHLEDPELNMSSLQPGEGGTVTAKTVGTHSFHDHFNAGKSGTLIVTE